jgi:hypothetical protein
MKLVEELRTKKKIYFSKIQQRIWIGNKKDMNFRINCESSGCRLNMGDELFIFKYRNIFELDGRKCNMFLMFGKWERARIYSIIAMEWCLPTLNLTSGYFNDFSMHLACLFGFSWAKEIKKTQPTISFLIVSNDDEINKLIISSENFSIHPRRMSFSFEHENQHQ